MSVPRRWPCSRRKRTGGMSCTPAHHSMDCAREQYVAHACVVTIGGPHPTRSARAGLDLNVFRLLAHQLAHPVSRRVRACRVPRGQPIHGVFARMPCGIYEHSEIIFPALAYFNLLRVPMTFLPVLIIGTSLIDPRRLLALERRADRAGAWSCVPCTPRSSSCGGENLCRPTLGVFAGARTGRPAHLDQGGGMSIKRAIHAALPRTPDGTHDSCWLVIWVDP